MSAKKFRLRKILLNEISLVDLPAESNSLISVFKRAAEPREGGGMSDLAQMTAEMARATTTIESLTKRAEEAEAKLVDQTKRAELAEAKVVEIGKRAASTDEADEDAILKAADPVVAAEIVRLRKSNAAATAALAKMAEAEEVAKAVARVRSDYPNLPVKAEDFGPVLKRAVGALSAEDAAELARVLKAADAAIVEATNTAGLGLPFVAKGSAEQEIEVAASEIAKTEKVSFAKGYDLALQRNPDLYRRYLDERGQAN